MPFKNTLFPLFAAFALSASDILPAAAQAQEYRLNANNMMITLRTPKSLNGEITDVRRDEDNVTRYSFVLNNTSPDNKNDGFSAVLNYDDADATMDLTDPEITRMSLFEKMPDGSILHTLYDPNQSPLSCVSCKDPQPGYMELLLEQTNRTGLLWPLPDFNKDHKQTPRRYIEARIYN